MTQVTTQFPPADLKWVSVGQHDTAAVEQFLDNAVASYALTGSALSIDLETTGLDPHSCDILVVGMSYNGRDVLLAPPSAIPVDLFNDVMANEEIPKVMHNAKFDMKFMKAKFGAGFEHIDEQFQNVDDTYVMHRLTVCGLMNKKSDLASASWQYLEYVMDKEVREKFIGASVVTDEMNEYAATDVAATWSLWAPLKAKIVEEELELLYDEIEKPLIPIVGDMELRGVKPDLEYLNSLRTMLEKKIVRYQAELDALVNQYGAMPTAKKKLTVAAKKAWLAENPGYSVAPEHIDIPEESFNINSSKQVVHVMNMVGLTIKSSSKEILESPSYSQESVRMARKRLEKVAKEGLPSAPQVPKAAKKALSVDEQLAADVVALKAQIEALKNPQPEAQPEEAAAAEETTAEQPEVGVPQLWSPEMTDDDALKAALDIAERVLDLRAARKAVDGFVIPLTRHPFPGQGNPGYNGPKGHLNPTTGKIHTSFSQLGADTGRFTDREPNFQQMPSARKDGVFEGFTFRRGFVPTPGMAMLVFDYQACEVRILAEMSRDKGLIAACENDDPHLGNAAIMFEEENGEVNVALVTKDQRTKSKTGIFTLVYGGGLKRIAAVLKCSKEAAARLMQTIFSKFPGVQRYINAMQTMAVEKGYVISLSGRKRYFDIPKKPEYIPGMSNFSYKELLQEYSMAVGRVQRQAQNAPIQATNADITKLAMIRVSRVLRQYGGHLLLTIHDELVAEVPEEHKEAAFEAMGAAMIEAEEEFFQHVKAAIDGKIGDHWVK